MDLFEAIRMRRSIKPDQMTATPVDRELIERLLDAANWAPSHGRTEPWRFVVHTSDARRRLAEVVAQGAADGDASMSSEDPRWQKTVRNMTGAPVVIAIVCQVSASPKIIEHEEIAATAMAVHNMHLAATALGLGAFWSSGKKAFHPRVAAFLELGATARCLGFFHVGWPAIPWPESERRPIAEKVVWRSTQ